MSNSSHLPANLSRGTTSFNAADLEQAIAQVPDGQRIAPAALAEYRAFYGLDAVHSAHQHEMFRLCIDNERIVVQYFVPQSTPQNSPAYVMLVHGYYDHVGLFAHVIQYLLSRNLAVVAFDQIGHGLSSGPRAAIDNFDRYVAVTRGVYQHARREFAHEARWHWIAQSMGGAIVMEYLQQDPPDDLGEVVLLAPLVRPYAWWINRWVFAVAKLAISERPRTLTNNAENPEFHALQAVDPLAPQTLPVAWVEAMVQWFMRFERYPVSALAPHLLQGDDDHTVAWKHNLKVFARRYPAAHHLGISGGQHHLANESAAIREQMWTYLDSHCHW